MDINLTSAISYPFKGQDWWAKIIIGGILVTIPGVLLALMSTIFLIPFVLPLFLVSFIGLIPLIYGYLLRVSRAVSHGEAALPDWDSWRKDYISGWLVFIGGLFYFLPVIVMLCLLVLVTPLIRGAFTEDPNPNDFYSEETLSGAGAAVLFLVTSCSSLFIVGAALALAVLHVNAYVAFARDGNFRDAYLDFGARFTETRTNIGGLLLLLAFILFVLFGAGVISAFPLALLTGLSFFLTWISNLIIANLVGQYARRVSDKSHAAIADSVTTPPSATPDRTPWSQKPLGEDKSGTEPPQAGGGWSSGRGMYDTIPPNAGSFRNPKDRE